MEKQKMETADMVKENIDRIGKLFPHCITETTDENGNPVHAIDFDKLRQELGEAIVEGKKERYQFTWPMKSQASALANTPTTMTLRPDKENSKNFDTTENLYIEGDNLEVLKVLRETYLGKVKMIYIDPPYNTGKDFVYKDNRFLTQKEMDTMEGKYDEYGNIYKTNTESNGRFHTDWLNMMYPRLKVARDLLSDDGVIFISIDDNEVKNLHKVCDEIFGETNFINLFVWVNKPEGRQIVGGGAAGTHEYILVYSKNRSLVSEFVAKAEWLNSIMPSSYKCSNIDIKYDEKGTYITTHELFNGNSKFNEETRPSLVFDIYFRESDGDIVIEDVSDRHLHSGYVKISPHVNADGVHKFHAYRWSREKIIKDKTDLEFIRSGSSYKIFTKRRDFDITTVRDIITDINTVNGNKDIRNLEIKGFDYPKPVNLINFLVKIFNPVFDKYDFIILDFFSGSASTAHAVMKLNAEDGGNRKFIMVQLAEETEEGSEARKAGYKNICEIGKERIRRAGEKVKEEAGLQGQDLDIGFRVLKLDSSNMKDVSVAPSQIGTFNFDDVLDNVKEGRTDLDLLFQIMLNNSIPLSARIEEQTINGHKIYNVDDGDLIAVFDRSVDDKTIKEIAKMQPLKFVMREPENSPKNKYNPDNIIDNFEQIFDLYSPNTIRRVL